MKGKLSNIYLLQGEYEKGLDLICKLEKEQPLPVNSREFSAIKSSLLFDLPELELTANLMNNLSLVDLAKLAAYRHDMGDITSYNNALAVIKDSSAPQRDIIQKALFPAPSPPKEVLLRGKSGQYSMDCLDYSLSPDGKNLVWIDSESGYWWKASTGKVVRLDTLTNVVSWSRDSKYAAQWRSDESSVIQIRRVADLEIVGRVSSPGKVLGWYGDQLYVSGASKVYQYTVTGEQTAAQNIPEGFSPVVSPKGDLGFVLVAEEKIVVKSDAIDKTFVGSVPDVVDILWLEEEAGLLFHSAYDQLWTTTNDTYHLLDFATGRISEITALGEAFNPLLDEYLWDGRTLYGLFTILTQQHLFRYDVISTQLDHTGIVLTNAREFIAFSPVGVIEAKDDNVVLYKLK